METPAEASCVGWCALLILDREGLFYYNIGSDKQKSWGIRTYISLHHSMNMIFKFLHFNQKRKVCFQGGNMVNQRRGEISGGTELICLNSVIHNKGTPPHTAGILWISHFADVCGNKSERFASVQWLMISPVSGNKRGGVVIKMGLQQEQDLRTTACYLSQQKCY